MSVKCILFIESVTYNSSGAGIVKARPAAKGPYAEYSQFTPTGSLELTSLNDKATEVFKAHLGKDMVVTFDTPTEDDLITPPFKA